MKSVKTLFFSIDNSKKEQNILINVDKLFNKTDSNYKDIFDLLDGVEAKPSKKVLENVLKEL